MWTLYWHSLKLDGSYCAAPAFPSVPWTQNFIDNKTTFNILGALPPLPSVPLNPLEEPATEGELGPEAGMKRKAAPEEEDVSDLIALYADIPQDPKSLQMACEALWEELAHHRKCRKEMLDEFVCFQAEAGMGG